MRQEFWECDLSSPSVEPRCIEAGYIMHEKDLDETHKKEYKKKIERELICQYPLPRNRPEDQHLCFSLSNFQTEHQ